MEELKEKMYQSSFKGLVGVATLLLLALAVSTAVDIKDKLKEATGTIAVSGTGEVYVKPDLAKTSFSVVTEAKTVAEALNENTEKMNAVINYLKGQGVEEKDLKTTSFNIYPRYEWREATQFHPTGERVLVGYEVTQSLEVKIRELAKTGELIQGAVDAGANRVGSLQFTVDDEDAPKAEAREEAISDAQEKAEILASQLGVSLVGIVSYSEGGYYPLYYGLEKAESASGAGDAAPQIEVGENKISVTVSVTYKIK